MNVVPITREQVDELPTFDDFWMLWPAQRRVSKKDARMAWDRIGPSKHVEVLTGLMDWRRVWEQRQEWEFVPHPHRWLQKERWEDALPAEFTRQANHRAANADFNKKMDEASAKRAPMPESLRTLLAELKAKQR